MTDDLKPGAVWVRKSDGQETTIISLDPATTYNAWVVHKGKRLTHTERRNFLRKYEPKGNPVMTTEPKDRKRDLIVQAAEKAIHRIECGCPYDGEHSDADIERRERIARAVLSVKEQA